MSSNVVDLSKLLTTQDICRMFARQSEMTIQLWRKNDGMPIIKIPGIARNTIRFDFEAVEKWAKKVNKRIYWVPEWVEKERGEFKPPIKKVNF